ncbi:The GLUG motif-containing protein [Geosporobacter subterraneus DSM 17957]|uniref:The GLUG motif-containing protein n=1 Tax=Geosporobacter subterraneus DSM 17957 TaxID=1121919 RepID=A0A1M6HXG5_9FIRM|nr:GLUG motif-containing protein [Geosporobacter subterraneus]SHJ26919.1 The GLUG motif-containing protein [Geosporobacter subterraneus DSM 17957]
MKKAAVRKSIIFILVFVMLISMTSGVGLAQSNDIDNHWAGEIIQKWIEQRLATGYPDNSFKPNNPITRAEFMVLANKAFGFTAETSAQYSDVKNTDWFSEDVKKAAAAGYIGGYPDGSIKPKNPISRQEAAVMVANIMNLTEDSKEADQLTDSEKIPDWSKGQVGAVVGKGYMSGYPDGSFKAGIPITRAEAIVTLNKAMMEKFNVLQDILIIDKSGVYGNLMDTEVIDKDVMIKAEGVTLQNMIIKRSLIIGEEVGDGEVYLKNVEVEGDTFIRGGGADSVEIDGGKYKRIIIQKVKGGIRIIAIGAKGTDVIIEPETEDNKVILKGSFENVTVRAKGVSITTQGETTIGRLTIDKKAEGTVITTSRETIVEEAVIHMKAKFNNEGRIKKATGDVARDSSYDTNLPENLIPTSGGGGGGGGGSTVQQVATPAANPGAGAVAGGTEITLTTTTAGASIYYSLDGSTPTASSTLYEGAITITESVTIKAIAVKAGMTNSNVLTAVYTIVPETLSDFAGGSGTEADPYKVATAGQLDKVRNYLDKHFIQVADIDLGVAPWNEGEGWQPISDFSNRFTGTYDGNGFTISNLTINRSEMYQALFGYLAPEGIVRNIGLDNVNITGNSFVAALVSFNEGSILNCYSEGSVSANNNMGGLVGQSNGEIAGCYTEGLVKGLDNNYNNYYFGGLVGRTNGAIIENCYSTAEVQGDRNVGGLVGLHFSSTVKNCYAMGSVTGSSELGGLIGNNNTGVITNSFYNYETTGQWGDGTYKTTEEMMAQGTYEDWEFGSTWGLNPEVNNGYPFLMWQGYEHVPEFAGGSGTLGDPYEIATVEHLNNVRKYLDKHYRQIEDIDLNDYVSENGAGYHGGNGWKPIGNYNNPFTGSFDGNSKTISNLTINRPDFNLYERYTGLFGLTGEEAVLENITLNTAQAFGNDYTGALVGNNNGLIENCAALNVEVTGSMYIGGLAGISTGIIDNCFSSGIVMGRGSRIGGLVGDNSKSLTSSAEIKNSFSTATVKNIEGETDVYNVGGLVGYNSGGTIFNCYATGNVSGHEEIGGLVGENWSGVIEQCYATGNVTGSPDGSSSSYYVGGLVGESGYNSEIIRSYATGAVLGQRNVGGLVGSLSSGGGIEDSYSLGQVSGVEHVGGLVGRASGSIVNTYAKGAVSGSSYLGGLAGYLDDWGSVISSYYDKDTTGKTDTEKGVPKSSEEMKENTTFVDWEFDSIWGINPDENDGYPFLRWQGYTHVPPILPTIASISAVGNVEVDYGTSEADAKAALAGTTTITDSDGGSHTVSLSWSIEDYDGNTAGDYTATGSFSLPSGVGQTDPATLLEVTATVTVKEEVVLSPIGDMLHAASGPDFVGVIYTNSGTIYYSENKNGVWSSEEEVGSGTDGRIAIDSSGNAHIVYTTSGKIGYKVFDGSSWIEEVFIESNDEGACSKPDIAVDTDGYAHITYTDTKGYNYGLWDYEDIMYANNTSGSFNKEVIAYGYRDNSTTPWFIFRYLKGSFITVNSNGEYMITYHEYQQYRDSGMPAVTSHYYGVNAKSGTANGDSTTYSATANDTVDLFDLAAYGNTIVVLYNQSGFKTSVLSESGGAISFADTVNLSGSSVCSIATDGIDIVVGGKSSSNLEIHYNGASQVYNDVVVKGSVVAIVNLGGTFYSVYTDNGDSNIKMRAVD